MIILEIILNIITILICTRIIGFINYLFTKPHGRRVLKRVKYLNVSLGELIALTVVCSIITLLDYKEGLHMQVLSWTWIYMARTMENVADMVSDNRTLDEMLDDQIKD